MGKTGNRVAGVLVAGLLMSSMSARADDATPVPAQDSAGPSTTQAAGVTMPPIAPPAANAPQNPGETTSASAGNANATGTAAAPNGNADGAGAASAPGNASAAAPAGNTGAGRQAENNAAAKNGASEAVKAGKKAEVKNTAAGKAAADNTAKAKNAKSGASATTPEIAKVSPCPDLNAAQVAEFVVQDYTQNRFQRSEQDQQTAGGNNINAWVNPEEVTGVGDVWQASLKVRGNAQDLNFAVTLDCSKGEITYRLNC